MRMTKVLLLLLVFLVLLMGISENIDDEYDNQAISITTSKEMLHARVIFDSDEKHEVFIDFNHIGPNSIMGIESLGLIKKEFSIKSIMSGNIENELMESCTDWIGPMIVRSADHTLNSKYIPEFTGGWHTVVRNGMEVKTGSTSSVSYYIDGKLLKNDTKTYGNTVEIIVTNLISGYNQVDFDKKGEIVKEIVTYKIVRGVVNVSVTLEALNDLIIERYYGLQTQNSLWDKVTYISSDKSIESSYETDVDNCSALRSDGKIVFSEFKLDSNLINLIVCLDTSFGLGNFENLQIGLPYIFTKKYGKTYFNLINGNPVTLSKGQRIQWQGSYIINLANQE